MSSNTSWLEVYDAHCIFTIMNHQRISTFWFCTLTGYSQEPRLKRIFEILQFLFEKISVFYSEWPKSWIWLTLGHVRNIFCKCHLQKAPKEFFWTKKFLNSVHRFKSAILAIFQFWQNGTFELVHGIQKKFWPKDFFWSV